MEKDFEELIAKRCEKALLENSDYRSMELHSDIFCNHEELQALAEIICYKKGVSDILNLLQNKNI